MKSILKEKYGTADINKLYATIRRAKFASRKAFSFCHSESFEFARKRSKYEQLQPRNLELSTPPLTIFWTLIEPYRMRLNNSRLMFFATKEEYIFASIPATQIYASWPAHNPLVEALCAHPNRTITCSFITTQFKLHSLPPIKFVCLTPTILLLLSKGDDPSWSPPAQ